MKDYFSDLVRTKAWSANGYIFSIVNTLSPPFLRLSYAVWCINIMQTMTLISKYAKIMLFVKKWGNWGQSKWYGQDGIGFYLFPSLKTKWIITYFFHRWQLRGLWKCNSNCASKKLLFIMRHNIVPFSEFQFSTYAEIFVNRTTLLSHI